MSYAHIYDMQPFQVLTGACGTLATVACMRIRSNVVYRAALDW